MLGTDLSIDHILFEECEGISESSTCTFCYDTECLRISSHLLGGTDILEACHDIIEADLPEVESEGTRLDRLWDFIDLSRREDELYMFWWLFECFEEGIKRS